MPPQSSTATVSDSTQSVSRRSLEVWTIWALCATLALAMVLITPSVAVSLTITKTFVLAAGMLVTLALYILSRLSRGNIILPPLVLVGALWLPAIAYILSSVFSGVPFSSALWGSSLQADTLGFVLIAVCLGTLAAFSVRRSEQYKSFLRVGAWVFAVVAIVEAGIVLIGQVAPGTISPAFSIVGSFEDLALILGLGVIGTLISFRFVEVQVRARRALSVVSIVSLALIAIANSSFIWILLALVSLGFFIETVMMRKPANVDVDIDEMALMDEASTNTDSNNHPIILPLVVLAVSLFFLVGGTLGSALANALHINVGSVSPSWQSTLSVAQKTYTTSPVFGTGPGTFGVQWLKYRDPALNSTAYWNVDFSSGIGFIPTSFVTTGLLGAIAWLAFFALFIVFGLRMLIMRTPDEAYVRYVAMLSFVASTYLFAAAIFRSPNTTVIALAFVFAGVFASTTRFATRGRQWGIIFSRSPRLGFVIVFSLTLVLLSSVVVAYSLVGRYLATVELTQASTAFATGNLTAADKHVQNSISFAPSSVAYQAQANIAIVSLRQIVASTTMDKTLAQKSFQTILSSGINAALTSTRLAPSDYQNWLALGNLYAQAVPLGVDGAYDSAKTAYDKAKGLNPTSPEILFILAQLDIAHKDIKAAQENLKTAIALKPDYINAIFLLSQLEVQDGNVKGALSSALSAAYFAPNDPNILFQVGVLSAADNNLPQADQALSAAVSANPQFANALYFLAAVKAKSGDLKGALAQLQKIASFSSDNEKAVAPLVLKLEAGKNPFPDNLLSASTTSVK